MKRFLMQRSGMRETTRVRGISLSCLPRGLWCSLGLAALLLNGRLLCAEAPPGRWEKVEAQESGTSLIVTLKSGERFEAEYLGSDAAALSVRREAGNEIRVPKQAVENVARRVNDSVGNGLLLGTAIGAGGAVLLCEGVKVARDRPSESGFSLCGTIGMLGGGIGALAGWLVDKGTEETEVLYEAP